MRRDASLPLAAAPAAAPRQALRLLYVINGLGTGGAERSLAEMLPFFRQAGFRVTVAVLHARKEGVEEQVLRAGHDVRFLGGTGILSWVRALRRLIAEERPELIHTTIFESDLVGRLAAVGSGIPVLTSLVNVSYATVRLQDPRVRRWRLGLVRLVDGWTARRLTTHFHAISDPVRDAAVQALGIAPERITVIERGRDAERLGAPSAERRLRARLRLGLDSDAEVLVTVGRQEFQKGQRYLLEAMARLAPERPRLTLLLAGRSGHASAELERLHAESGLGDRVRFLGHRNDVPELLAAADLFVFPSLYEGLGGSLIEAMALGLPIVASDVPTLRAVVEDGRNALLVEPASPTALADAITQLLEDRPRASAFACRGREIFHARFTMERSASRMIQLYREVARPRRRALHPA